MKPEQTADEWLEEFVPGYSQLPSANSIMNDEGEYVEFDDDYFQQDDEYISLVNSRDDDDEDFNFDDFNLDNLEPEEEDYSGLDDFFSDDFFSDMENDD
jgi:hypothetical protein